MTTEKPWFSVVAVVFMITGLGNHENARANEWNPDPAQAKVIASVCEGYRLIAGAMFSLNQQGKPRVPGTNYLAERIADEIYSPTTSVMTEEMAKKRSDEICIPLVTESERLKQLRANMAAPVGPFEFESVISLDDMSSLIRSRFSLGTSRTDIRRTFVDEGRATLRVRTDNSAIEKYIYDINLCHYYVWRWNISVDYDANSRLQQAYINGDPVFPDGTPKRAVSKVAEAGKKASIYRAQRPRPEAYKGEKSLAFILFDRDSDPATTDDQVLVGAGPSRADPVNMGKLVAYTDIDPWRSIFDSDATERIVPYRGDCNKADKHMEAQRR